MSLTVDEVYRTRAKVVSSKPIFNAGTERFMRDWRSGIVTVTVRDQRHRQHDPILGVVPLKLSEILSTSCQVTRWYPLDGGIVCFCWLIMSRAIADLFRASVVSESLCSSELSRLAYLQICSDGTSVRLNLHQTESWHSITMVTQN